MNILKTGVYYVSIEDKILIYNNEEDCSNLITDFEPFRELDIEADGDDIALQIDMSGRPIFTNYPKTIKGVSIDASRVAFAKIKEQELTTKEENKYAEYKKAANDIYLVMTALMDVGFTREEAVHLIETIGRTI